MDGEFSFTAAELDRGGRAYRFPLTRAWLQGALDARRPAPEDLPPGAQPPAEGAEVAAGANDGSVEVRASRSEKEVIVHGHAKGCLNVACARCTKPFDLDLEVELSALYVPKSKLKAAKQDYEFSSEEADIETYDGETVILDELVLDTLLLEIPMIPLCSEDCPGMSPPPGQPQGADEPDTPAIDPRLLPLMRFKGSA